MRLVLVTIYSSKYVVLAAIPITILSSILPPETTTVQNRSVRGISTIKMWLPLRSREKIAKTSLLNALRSGRGEDRNP